MKSSTVKGIDESRCDPFRYTNNRKRKVREEKKPESKKFPFKCDFFHLLLVFKDEIVY